MRGFSLIVGVTCAILGTAVATTRQDEPLAENQFKNIKSFKGMKAKDLIPAMQFMDASLKVECSYCHTDDRASDDKKEKASAREMIAMQKEINDKNFDGRTVVTCATCHAGHTHPVAVPPVLGSEVRARRSNDVSPVDVLAAYSKALGSAPSTATDGLKLVGKATSRGETNPFDATYAGDKFIQITHRTAGDQKSGYDGTSVWFTTPKGVQRVPAEFGIQYRRENALITSINDLPKLNNPTGGTSKISGKDMVVVSGNIGEEKGRTQFYFDKATGLLARTVYSYPTVLGTISQINDYSDYIKVGDLQVPSKIANHSPEGDTLIEISSAVPAKVDASVFDPGK